MIKRQKVSRAVIDRPLVFTPSSDKKPDLAIITKPEEDNSNDSWVQQIPDELANVNQV